MPPLTVDPGGTVGHGCQAPLMLDHLFLDTVGALRAALDESLLERAGQEDRLVYDLYGLTEEEIAVVEGATANENGVR